MKTINYLVSCIFLTLVLEILFGVLKGIAGFRWLNIPTICIIEGTLIILHIVEIRAWWKKRQSKA